MNGLKVIAGSLQYSPVYKSLCGAFGRQCQRAGHDVRYLLSSRYEWLLAEDMKDKSYFIGRSDSPGSSLADGINPIMRRRLNAILEEYSPDVIYMLNFHPFFNLQIAGQANKKGIRFVQHVHEPYVENKKAYKGANQYWLHAFERAQEKLLKKTDVAVLSSDNAYDLFLRRYKGYKGKMLKIPLIQEDVSARIGRDAERRYVLFVGPPVAAKGPETFLDLVDASEAEGLDTRFLMVSRLPVKDRRFSGKKCLEVIYKKRITDEELAGIFAKSLMTVTPYRTARQSSVVTMAYMCGTPVLSSAIEGLLETVYHKETGYVVDPDADVGEWVKGMRYILDGRERLSAECRRHYEKYFSEARWQDHLSAVIGE